MKKDEIAEKFMKHFEKITELRKKNKDMSLAPVFDALDDDFDGFCELVNDILYPEQAERKETAEALILTRDALQNVNLINLT